MMMDKQTQTGHRSTQLGSPDAKQQCRPLNSNLSEGEGREVTETNTTPQ